MNKQQAKDLLPIIQAYAEGNTIQVLVDNQWVDLPIDVELRPTIGEYRIKPIQKYRPFKDKEECWNEMLKHQPFGWTKLMGKTVYSLITDVDNDILYSDAFKECTFADGTPFGIKEYDKCRSNE